TVCVVGKIRDLILQLSKSSIYSTKPFMPELKWGFGYPGAIIFMILAGLAPYLYFKRKNWL
ncbi:hypothetical protein, partial [Escherichia coli]